MYYFGYRRLNLQVLLTYHLQVLLKKHVFAGVKLKFGF